MQIKDLMTQPVITCPADAMLDQAARLMWEFDCGMIPVIGDDGRLVGVVTDRDICMAAYTQGQALSNIPVSTAMAKNVVAGHVSDTVEQLEWLMRTSQIRRIPILEGEDRLVGVVSLNDLARLAARAHKNGVDRELVKTLAAVCQPRCHPATPDRPAVVQPTLAV